METLQITTNEQLEQAFAIRREVFVDEQGLPKVKLHGQTQA